MAWDGRIILLEKVARTVPYGFLAVLFPIYLSQLGFDAFLIGVVLTLTVATSAGYTFVASFVADRLGRRRTLIFFAMTDAIAGALLLASAAWWAPIAAGIVGNMSAGSGETGPFLSLDQAILPRTADLKRRTMTFSLYNLIGYSSLSAGSLLAGLPPFLGPGVTGYRPLFLAYLLSGLLGGLLYSRLTNKIEQDPSASSTRRVLSRESKRIVYKMSALFSVDAFAGGFVGQSILSYFFYPDRRKDRQMDRPHPHNGLHTHTIQHSPHRHPLRPNSYTGCDSATLQTISLANGRADATVLPDERGPRIG